MAEHGTRARLIGGVSCSGKSTLIAHWLRAWHKRRPGDILFVHYLGASPDSADPALLMRRPWEHLNRATCTRVYDLERRAAHRRLACRRLRSEQMLPESLP